MTKDKLPADYEQRVYAGWLGKCIGVRFGAPLENWTYQEIKDNFGELDWYAFGEGGKVFKPDDDTSVPVVYLRALEDYGLAPTAGQLGETLLNYVGDQHGTFWWGGYGISSEHTAYLNLASGIPAPRSGSVELNGATLAEQIGGQIFSDIWGLLAPNNPKLAAEMAGRASSVMHGGNAIYGGQFVAALVSAAFSERDPGKLIDVGLAQIPGDSEYARVIKAVVEFHRQNPDDWHACYAFIKANFGYDRYGGVVHIIPNAGIVAMALLYGSGDFSRTIRVANMGGWDTDCNVGNVGAILGVAVGVEGIDTRWREPINDLQISANVIGTRNVLTIPQIADLIAGFGRQIAGEAAPESTPRYHFRYPGSINNFQVEGERAIPTHREQIDIDGVPALRMVVRKLNKKGEARLFTRTYYRPSELSANSYGAMFTPLIAPGQTIRARVHVPADAPESIRAALFVCDGSSGAYTQAEGTPLTPGQWHDLTFTVPPLDDALLSQVGVLVRLLDPIWERGSVDLEYLDWDGAPSYRTSFTKERAETTAISGWTRLRGYWRLENGGYAGSGVGESETYSGDVRWRDYRLSAALTPLLGSDHRVNVRVQGASRSYAFGLAAGGRVALYRKAKTYSEVASAPFDWKHGETYTLTVAACGDELTGTVEGSSRRAELHWQDADAPYLNGQIGLSTGSGGHTVFRWVEIRPHPLTPSPQAERGNR